MVIYMSVTCCCSVAIYDLAAMYHLEIIPADITLHSVGGRFLLSFFLNSVYIHVTIKRILMLLSIRCISYNTHARRPVPGNGISKLVGGYACCTFRVWIALIFLEFMLLDFNCISDYQSFN